MYKLNENSITRLSDNACIPLAEGNTDYQTYLAWLANGNTPEPADIPDPQIAINAKAKQYLADTDWYVVRFSELGTPIPNDIKVKRQEARSVIV